MSHVSVRKIVTPSSINTGWKFVCAPSGNRTQEIETIAGSPTTTNYGYNAANQMTSMGATTLTYDNNGNLLGDGTNTYAWDRANRMIGVGSTPLAPPTRSALQCPLMFKQQG